MYPSSFWGAKWKEAIPVGNGVVGASVYGGVYKETVLLNHADLWTQGITAELPDVSDKLRSTRELLAQGKAEVADHVIAQSLKDAGYNAEHALPLPLGDLHIIMDQSKGFEDYSRTLDMETGEVSVSWLEGRIRYERVLFVSRSDDVIIYELSCSEPDHISCILKFDVHGNGEPEQFKTALERSLSESKQSYGEDNYLYYAVKNDNGMDFGAVARVELDGGSITNKNGSLQIQEANRVLIYIRLFVNGARQECWQELKSGLNSMTSDYFTLLERHASEHSRLFHAMKFNLHAPDRDRYNEEYLMDAYKGKQSLALMEKMWSFGRHLLISSTREGGQPCHLYGLWCGEYNALWAFHMVNLNLQMIYWQALSGNMPELLLPVFDYMEDKLEDFRTNAKRLFGCRGIFVPAPTTPESGLLKITYPHIIHWISGAGWIAQFYVKYYQYTLDEDFLRQRTLPFLYETALFYEDYFTIGEDGFIVISPSISPENTPSNYVKQSNLDGYESGGVMETTMNATMDYAVAKEVWTSLVNLAPIAGMYGDEVAKWNEMLARIPAYQTNEDGAIREWMHPGFDDNDQHRHLAHIYPLFPGSEIDMDSPPGQYNPFVKAVDNRANDRTLREQCAWSFMYIANAYARMGKGEEVIKSFEKLSKANLLSNLFTLCNDWRDMGLTFEMPAAPFQIDANMGWCAVVQEMLVLSSPGKIRVLHALPQSWSQGKAGPMLAHGSIEVTLEWDLSNKEAQVELCATKIDQTIELIVGDQRTKIELKAQIPSVFKYEL
ncbi:glycoside hydrolase family 95 protein [Paenibacillus psychroresistens]|uniref:Glycoside hydrolase family 95 protein n=2 Tax=Paenibacillus psychroresistens TaxID=1778678 RepID=A0A6B8RXM9_9BACL|nr:glycoside hydrolase family 95 protein [Paenibacillus psychroresistens]